MKKVTPRFKTPKLEVQQKFALARKEMSKALIERDEEIDIVLTALICREHPLFVGPPGTAKSLMLDSLMRWMGPTTKKFSILFNKFTVPEEVFGPISVQGLKEDCYRRITTGMLPEADVGFGDEIFKASSAILNTLLRILNERVYSNGNGHLVKVPLILFVGASNEYPNQQEELGALFDRFLLRKTVKYISNRKERDKLLWERDHTPQFSMEIGPGEIEAANVVANCIEFGVEAKKAFLEIVDELNKEGIKPGDRRMFKAVDAVKAYSYLSGDETGEVQIEHLEILKHILWDDPTEQPEKCAKIVAKIANPTGSIVTEKLIFVQDIIEKGSPTDIVAKLQVIHKELDKLPKTGTNEKRVKSALNYIAQEIKTQYNKIVPEVVQ